MIKNLLFILLVSQLSSCVVLHQEYFYPEAEGANVEKQSCRGKVGVDNQLVFQFEDIKADLHVWENNEITYLGISFQVYKNAQVLWPDQVIELYVENEKQELIVGSFDRLRTFVNEQYETGLLKKKYAVDSIMDRTTEEKFETYYESFILAEKAINQLIIEKIRLLINGNEHTLSEMQFNKTSGFFLHPLNC